jgi:2-iminobutanoate/2-iminopropanoate deaminase
MDNPNAFSRQILVRPPKPELPFSVAVGYGPFVFLSGLVGRDPVSGAIAKGDVAAQTEQTLKNLGARLEEAGSSLAQALKVTVFLTDMTRFAEMNAAYRRCFAGDLPARSCVQVGSLPDHEALVEIELVAAR